MRLNFIVIAVVKREENLHLQRKGEPFDVSKRENELPFVTFELESVNEYGEPAGSEIFDRFHCTDFSENLTVV